MKRRANGNLPAPPSSLPPRRGPLSTDLGVVFWLVLKSRATFTFKGPPTYFPGPVRAPAPFSIRLGILPAHFLPLLGARRHPGRGGWTRGAPASPPPPSHWRPKGLQERGGGPQRDRITDGSVPGGEGTKRGSHGPVGARRRAIDNAGLSLGTLSSRFCRDRHGASGGSRGAAGTPGALTAPAARAEQECGAHFELALRPLVTQHPG